MFEQIALEIKRIATQTMPLAQLSDEQLLNEIEQIVNDRLKQYYISIEKKVELINQVFSSFRGFGVLDVLIKNEDITEIMVNGHDEIFIEKMGRIERVDLKFANVSVLEHTIQKIVGMAGREVNQAHPIVDTRLPDGSRVNVVLAPVALNGPILTIRKFSREPMTMDKLIQYGSLPREIVASLEKLVRAKYNIFISGGTGSGKTTFLNALANLIPKDERVITIEDSAELQLPGIDNLVSLETRNANSSGAGQVTVSDLIRASLRARPERIIVGEVRGGEALDMLQAMNTGHAGSLSTGHSNSAQDMLVRLETMVLQKGFDLPLEATRQQIASAIDIIIHLSRMRDKSRKTVEISEVVGLRDGEIYLNPLFVFEEESIKESETVTGRLTPSGNPLINQSKLNLAGIEWE